MKLLKFCLVGTTALMLSSCSGGGGTIEINSVAPTNDDMTSSETSPSTDVQISDEPVSDQPKATCAFEGVDVDFGEMQVELTFSNPLGEVDGLELTYGLFSGDVRFFTGSAGGLDLVDIDFPKQSEQFRLAVDTGEDLPSNINVEEIVCEVLAIEEATQIGGYQRTASSDTCEIIRTDEDGQVFVSVKASNPYEELTDVQVFWAFYDQSSIRFASDTDIVEKLNPGEKFQIDSEYGVEKPQWIEGSVVSCAVIGFWDYP